MKRENTLRRRLRSIETLSEAVGAMKSLASHHFRSARAALPAARDYREGVDKVIASLGLHQLKAHSDATAMLLIAADLGLCGAYNSQLAASAVEFHNQLGVQLVYVVGHRPRSILKRANLKVDREYSAPTSVEGLTDLLLRLGEDLLTDYLQNKFGTLHVVSARFDGVGKFTPTCTRLLPIDPPQSDSPIEASTYVTPDHLASVAIREYLYIKLFQTSLDALASEHGSRLVATEAAGQWLSEKSFSVRRQLASVRRELATQEVLDIASSAKRRKAIAAS